MTQVAILGGTFDPVHWGHLLLAETALSQLGLERVIWVPSHRPPHKRGSAYKHRRSMVENAIALNPAFVLSPLQPNPTQPDYAVETLLNLQSAYPNCHWYWIIGLDAFQTLPLWYRRETLIPACDWLVAPRPVSGTGTDAILDQAYNLHTHKVSQVRLHELHSQRTQENLNLPLPFGFSFGVRRTLMLLRRYRCALRAWWTTSRFANANASREQPSTAPYPSENPKEYANNLQPSTFFQDSGLCQQVTRQLAAQNIPIRWQMLQMPPVGISSSLIRHYCRQGRSIRYLVPDAVRAYITTHNLYLD